MCCASLELRQRHLPHALQGLALQELVAALEEPGQDHFGTMVSRELVRESDFSMILALQTVLMHLVYMRFQGACESPDLEVLVPALQEEFCGCCCPPRIWRQSSKPPDSLEELCKAEELLLHGEVLSVHSPNEAPRCMFEKDDGQLATRGFTVIGSVLLACQGLVLCNVEEHRGSA